MHAWPWSGVRGSIPIAASFLGLCSEGQGASQQHLPPSIPQYSCVRGAPKGEMQVSEELVVTQPLAPHHPAARTARQNCEMQTG